MSLSINHDPFGAERMRLFRRPNGSPLNFCITGCNKNRLKGLAELIKAHGGGIDKDKKTIVKFTPSEAYKQELYPCATFYDVEFIDESVKQLKIVDPQLYRLGTGNPVDVFIMEHFLTGCWNTESKPEIMPETITISDSEDNVTISPVYLTAEGANGNSSNMDTDESIFHEAVKMEINDSVPNEPVEESHPVCTGTQMDLYAGGDGIKNDGDRRETEPCDSESEREVKFDPNATKSLTIAGPLPNNEPSLSTTNFVESASTSDDNSTSTSQIRPVSTRRDTSVERQCQIFRTPNKDCGRYLTVIDEAKERTVVEPVNGTTTSRGSKKKTWSIFDEAWVDREITSKDSSAGCSKVQNIYHGLSKNTRNSSEKTKVVDEETLKNKKRKIWGDSDMEKPKSLEPESNSKKEENVALDTNANLLRNKSRELPERRENSSDDDIPFVARSENVDTPRESDGETESSNSDFGSSEDEIGRSEDEAEPRNVVTAGTSGVGKTPRFDDTEIIIVDSSDDDDNLVKQEEKPVLVTPKLERRKPEGSKRTKMWRQTLISQEDKNPIAGKYRRRFSIEERKTMVRYLLDKNVVHDAKGLIPWSNCVKDGILSYRTPQSLLNHFQRCILPNIAEANFLRDDEKIKFQKLWDDKQANRKKK